MPKIVTWDTEDQAKKELAKRLYNCLDDRRNRQYRWERNERTIFNTDGGNFVSSNLSYSFDSDVPSHEGADSSSSSIGTNYSFKNLRFIHAQLSANPPSVVPRPTSNDPDDRRKADAADRVIRYGMRQYKMQEEVDRASLATLTYGTGFAKTVWNPEAGEILEVDEESGEITMEGDFDISVPNIWDIFVDPDATRWEDVRYVFERLWMPYEEACFMFPDQKELLKQHRTQHSEIYSELTQGGQSAIEKNYYDVVEIYQYWEKGLPVNGYLGRFCWCTKNGQLLKPVEANPERYPTGTDGIPKAVLPYHIFSDIDVPHQLWGKSSIEFAASLQDNLNRLDSVILENVQAHGVARLILPEGAEVADDSITNSPWDIVRITGTQPPHYMTPMPLPPAMDQLRATMQMGVNDVMGVNEAMFGQQSREQSGFSMQYATNQGNMIRRRLFNKYVLFVESIYKRYLQIIQKHWSTPRTIHVLGKEKAFEAIDLKGADIAGGYDLVVEYGASLSLDPTTRREEIMTLMPIFEKAGVETSEILSMLKLNELSNLYDMKDLAKDRQREIFEEMVASGLYIAPEELQAHPEMLAYAYRYLMTVEFKYLKDYQKNLIRRHVREREQLAAQQQASAAAQGAPGPAPQGPAGGLPAVPGQGAPLDVGQLGETFGGG